MIKAATENNTPETHSIVFRPSQSAEGPATVTLATAPMRVDATTKPSRAGVASKLNSGFIYSNAPADIHPLGHGLTTNHHRSHDLDPRLTSQQNLSAGSQKQRQR
jgi:hypothetical protein